MYLLSPNLRQRRQEYIIEKRPLEEYIEVQGKLMLLLGRKVLQVFKCLMKGVNKKEGIKERSKSKGGKNIQWGKDSIFNKQCWENLTATCKRMKLEHFLTPHTKINSKCIKELNGRPETIKLLEENIGRTLDDINQSKIIYDPPPTVTEIKTKVNKWT